MAKNIVWLDSLKALDALREIKSDCEHPRNRVRWKLSTAEYHCRECQTLFSYDEVAAIVNSSNGRAD